MSTCIDLACPTCGTQFTRTHSRNIYCRPECRADPHPKVTLTCDGCGGPAIKDRRTAPRGRGTYCSTLCHDFVRWGGQSCKLPRYHIARWAGMSSEWSPRTGRPTRNTGACTWCGETNPRDPSAAYCSDECKLRAKRVRRRGREHGAAGEYSWREVTLLWKAFGKACAYCSTPTPLTEIEAEHVQPLSRGGRNDIGNLLPSCKPCNSDKRDLLLTEWNVDRARRGMEPRATEWSVDDMRYRHLVANEHSKLAA